MKISLHWAKSSGPANDKEGAEWFLISWAGSNISEKDAEKKAEEKRADLAQRLSQLDELQHYAYISEHPVREEVIECFGDPNNPRAAITRNRYGALVLNAARVFFADVDIPVAKQVELNPSLKDKGIRNCRPGLLGFFTWLVSGRKRIPYEDVVKTEQKAILDRFDSFHSRYPSVNFRAYETAGGYRAIVTNHSVDPESYESQDWLEAMQSDPLYRLLCEKQACYRARLTPKPWRLSSYCRIEFYPGKFNEDKPEVQQWLDEYKELSSAYAVCRLVRSFGDDEMTDEAREVVGIHDQYVLDESAGSLA